MVEIYAHVSHERYYRTLLEGVEGPLKWWICLCKQDWVEMVETSEMSVASRWAVTVGVWGSRVL